MSRRARAPDNPGRDTDATPITVGARVEQSAIATEHGALSTRGHHVVRKGQQMADTMDRNGRTVAPRACARCGAELPRPPEVADRLREAGFFTREPIRRALAAYDFGYLFRAVRRTLELTQVQLGDVLDLGQDRISRIERRQYRLRDIETIARVASRLGIPPTLLGFSADTLRFEDETHPVSIRPPLPPDTGNATH